MIWRWVNEHSVDGICRSLILYNSCIFCKKTSKRTQTFGLIEYVVTRDLMKQLVCQINDRNKDKQNIHLCFRWGTCILTMEEDEDDLCGIALLGRIVKLILPLILAWKYKQTKTWITHWARVNILKTDIIL